MLNAFFRKDRAEEGALIANNAARFFCVLECSLTLRVLHGLQAVILILRQRRKREHRERDVVCTFCWKKVPVVFPAKFFNQRNPEPSIIFKLCKFERVDDVAKVTGDHDSYSFQLELVTHLLTGNISFFELLQSEIQCYVSDGTLRRGSSLRLVHELRRSNSNLPASRGDHHQADLADP